LRDQQPVCRLQYPDGHVGWLVTGYALARKVLADSRFSLKPERPVVGDPEKSAAYRQATADSPIYAGAVGALDPPAHTRIRRLQTGYFTVRRVNEHRASIERIVGGRLDAMKRAGPPVDFVQEFALPVPSIVICELLGVPPSDRHEFEHPTAVLQDPDATNEEKIAAMHTFCDYCQRVVEQKRVHPTEDLLSELVATGELTDDELTGIALQLFDAGHETTASMLSLSVFALLCDRDQWEMLRAEPSLIENAVEELLRHLTLVQLGAFTRTALEDVELDDLVIKAGESVTVSLTAANRDPARFADPDKLDFHRDAVGHLAFGHGRHMCLGMHLARLEMQVGIAALIERFPTLRLAVSADEVPLESSERFLYGVRQLQVAW